MSTPAPPEQPAAEPGAPPPPRRRGMRGTGYHMVLSMGVVLLGCLVWLAIQPRETPAAKPVENVSSIAREVGLQQRWDVALPAGLGEGWVPVNVRLLRPSAGPATWHAGYQTPTKEFVSVEQTRDGDQAWVRRQVGAGRSTGTVALGGGGWTRYEGDDRRALVRATPLGGLRTVVVGKAEWPEIEQYAKALRSTAPAG